MIGIYSVEAIASNHKTLTIEHSARERASQCSFNTYDEVREWDEILIETDYGDLLSAGIVDEPTHDRTDNRNVTTVSVGGYRKIFDRNSISESYEGMLAGDIVKSIISTYCPGFIANTNVADGSIIETIIFNFSKPTEAINKIADALGYEWYIDQYKELFFFAKSATPAPHDITTESNFHKGLEITPDITNLVNQIIVRGGTFQTAEQTYEQYGDTAMTQFVLPEKPQDITVLVDGVAKTLGIKFPGEDVTTDFLVNYNEKYIENGLYAVLTDAQLLTVLFKYQAPLRIRKRNDTSIDAMKLMFPDTDGVFEKVINDNEINSRDVAFQVADANLNAYSNTNISGRFKTFNNEFAVGQVLTINVPQFSGEAVIQGISSRCTGGAVFEHTVKFATVLFGFEEFMRELYAARKVELIENEIVETLYEFSDRMNISETITTTIDQNRQNEEMEMLDENYIELNKTLYYVFGDYFPVSFADDKRVFMFNASLLG